MGFNRSRINGYYSAGEGFRTEGSSEFQDSVGGVCPRVVKIDASLFRSNTASTGTGISIPSGAVVLDVIFISANDVNTTVDVGVQANGDAFADGLSVNASGRQSPLDAWAGSTGTSDGSAVEVFANVAVAAGALRGELVITYA